MIPMQVSSLCYSYTGGIDKMHKTLRIIGHMFLEKMFLKTRMIQVSKEGQLDYGVVAIISKHSEDYYELNLSSLVSEQIQEHGIAI